MPKATLTFNLPEENEEHQLALKGSNWHSVVWEMDQWLRSQLKYGHKFKGANKALEAARDELHSLVANEELSLL